MNYLIIESIIYIAWTKVFLKLLRDQTMAAIEKLLIIVFAIPIVILMEVINEYRYASIGVYYPFSLFYFPGFKFPFAIVLSSSLFPLVLHIFSRQIAISIFPNNNRFLTLFQWGIFLTLISLNAIPEWLGVATGYWEWRFTPPFTLDIQIAKYIFYFWFAFPPVLVAKFFCWRVMNKNGNLTY